MTGVEEPKQAPSSCRKRTEHLLRLLVLMKRPESQSGAAPSPDLQAAAKSAQRQHRKVSILGVLLNFVAAPRLC